MFLTIGKFFSASADVLKTWINYRIVLSALVGGSGGLIAEKLTSPRRLDIQKLEAKMQSLITKDNALKQQHKFLREYSRYLRLLLNKPKTMRIS